MCIDNNYIFNTICHMLALEDEGKINVALAKLVLTILTIETTLAPSSLDEINIAIERIFKFTIPNRLLQEAVDQLLTEKSVRWVRGVLIIDPEKRSEVEAIIKSARELQEKVRSEWFFNIADTCEEYQQEWENGLWNCLQTFTGKALRRYGVNARVLLDSRAPITTTEATQSLELLFREAYEECVDSVQYDFVAKYISLFFRELNDLRKRYLSELLNGAFTFFALVSDETVSSYMRVILTPVSVFVDTNFIFGVVELHNYPFNEISKEILSLVEKNDLPLRFLVLDRTLKEYKETLEYYGGIIKRQSWQPAMSRAALTNGHMSSIERKYHELNAESPLDPEIFLTKYRRPEILLKDHGFEFYTLDQKATPEHDELKKRLIEQYKLHITTRFPDRQSKRYESLEHDVTLLLTAQGHRAQGSRILDAGAMCLTIDSTLYSFDWYENIQGNPLGVTIFPNQLLYLLRPFVSQISDFEGHFVKTFALPEFQVIETDYSEVKHRVLDYLNSFSNMNTETAIHILTDAYLLRRLQEVPVEENDEFEDLIEKAIVQDNIRLQKENEILSSELTDAKTRIREMMTQLGTLNQVKEKAEKLFSYITLVIRIIISIVFASISLSGLFILPGLLKWDWLTNHPAKTSLYTATTAIVVFIMWIIIDKNTKRRKFVLASLILPCLWIAIKVLGK